MTASDPSSIPQRLHEIADELFLDISEFETGGSIDWSELFAFMHDGLEDARNDEIQLFDDMRNELVEIEDSVNAEETSA